MRKRRMAIVASMVAGLSIASGVGRSVLYDDLKDVDTSPENTFWDVSDHAGVAIDETDGDLSGGVDSRVRVEGESDAIPFSSFENRGFLLIVQ